MFDWLVRQIAELQGVVFEGAIEPTLFQLGLMDWAEEAFDGVGFALFGALQIMLAYLVCRPLELWRPAERWSDRGPVRTDVVYTLIHRLGLVPMLLFLVLTPIGAVIDGSLRFYGFVPPAIEQLIPGLAAWPLVTLLIYVVIIDAGEYWRHRLQHGLPWWWALHSIHHDQRQMTLWSDDRNHVVDDVLATVWRGTIAMMIGVTPAEFPVVMLAFPLVESLSHANVRLGFGRWGSALLVGPQFHRVHHAIEHARPPYDGTRGCNFAVIFPIWDAIFGTWRRERVFPRTGVAALTGDRIRCGYLRHQLDGFSRLAAALAHLIDRRRRDFVAAFPAE